MKYITGRFLSCLPHHQVSSFSGKMTKAKLSRLAIKPYAKYYKVDLSCIEKPVDNYKSLNQFFTRRLKPGSRPIADEYDAIISPSDGLITQAGIIEDGSLLQAKGVGYSLNDLLGDTEQADIFLNGSYMTVYLSPRDYHRVHAPISGTVTGFSYIPGRLFPVNRIGVRSINGLYSKNERLITYMNTEAGRLAIVKVGAFIVGSVQVAYRAHIQKLHKGKFITQKLSDLPYFHKGDEIGHFEFGSTVIVVFEKDLLQSNSLITPGQFIKMGERIGSMRPSIEQPLKVAATTI